MRWGLTPARGVTTFLLQKPIWTNYYFTSSFDFLSNSTQERGQLAADPIVLSATNPAQFQALKRVRGQLAKGLMEMAEPDWHYSGT